MPFGLTSPRPSEQTSPQSYEPIEGLDCPLRWANKGPVFYRCQMLFSSSMPHCLYKPVQSLGLGCCCLALSHLALPEYYIIIYILSFHLLPLFFPWVILSQVDGRSGASSSPIGPLYQLLRVRWDIFSGEGDLALPPALQLVHCWKSFLFCQGDVKKSGLKGSI